MDKRPLHIVILAAGKGSRMHSGIPKVLHRIAGQSLLEHVILSSLELDPAQIHVVVGHGKEQVIAEFADKPYHDTLRWVEQSQQLGTGHAVSTALPGIDGEANVLMLTADVPLIKSATLAAMIDSMISTPLALLTAIVDDASGLGRITRDASNGVSGIVEHKDANPTQLEIREINSGIMCARSELLLGCLNKINNNNAQQEYYLTDIVGLAYEGGNPISTLHPSSHAEVMGINDRLQLAKAEQRYQQTQRERLMASGVTLRDPSRVDIRGDVSVGADTIIDVNVVIQGPTVIGGNVLIAPNCVISGSDIADNVSIHANTVIEGAKIAEGVNVGPFARLRPGTELGERVRIGNFVETKNSQLDAGAKVNHLSYVGDATVGSNTNIGAGVITCNYDGANKHKTTIGKDVFVGSDSQLVAPVEIKDGATIGAGSTITNKVEKGRLAISRARQRQISDWRRPTKVKDR